MLLHDRADGRDERVDILRIGLRDLRVGSHEIAGYGVCICQGAFFAFEFEAHGAGGHFQGNSEQCLNEIGLSEYRYREPRRVKESEDRSSRGSDSEYSFG